MFQFITHQKAILHFFFLLENNPLHSFTNRIDYTLVLSSWLGFQLHVDATTNSKFAKDLKMYSGSMICIA